ncbi:hypothetical protein NP493_4227g00001 [Ridgeia piscesae]|uniref:Uncharacterized protein n=1 Tax=Ridgeia piscesae TaxID=27915 RepID=A0AAD9MUL6_RIDPI|nr:hypothetical protein NP493_4227g00001 [Ridgeia piscesae]
MRPSCFAGQLWPPSTAPSQGGTGGGQRCQTGQRSRSLAVIWRGSGRESCMLQLSDLFVFWQYEIDLSTQTFDTCADMSRRLSSKTPTYDEQSVTVIWMTHIHRWWTAEKASGRRRNEKRLLLSSPHFCVQTYLTRP